MRKPRLPVLHWLAGYDLDTLRHDLAAGLTVGVMLVPQSMAYAQLAGLPPIYGLYASVVPLLVHALLGSSLHIAAGVVALDMLILHAGLEGLAEPGSPRWIELAILLTLVTGAIQVLMALGRMGFLVTLLSRPVITGFASGAAILIALSQVGPLLAVDLEGARTLPAMLWMLVVHVADTRPGPLILGAASIAALLGLKAWRPVFPGALAVVVAGTLVVVLLDPAADAIARVGDVPAGLPSFVLPRPDGGTLAALWPTALTLALVQFTMVSSLGKVFAARFGYRVSANRELGAIGAANLIGSFFQSLPVSASVSRSALNVESGARTPAANMTAALVATASLLFLTSVLGLIPVPVLSAIIIVAALSLADIDEIRVLLKAKTVDGWIAIITLAATLGAGIVEGVLAGVVASVVALLYRISRPNAAVLGHLPGTRSFRDVRHRPEARQIEGILLLRVDASFSFINAEFLKDFVLDRTVPGCGVRAVVLDASGVNDLDTTAAEVLVSIRETLDQRGIPLYFAGAKEPMTRTLRRSGLDQRLGPESFFLSPHRAVTHVLQGWGVGEEYMRTVQGPYPGSSG